MRLSTDQIERLAERIFKVLDASGHIAFDYEVDDKINEKAIETIAAVLEEDSRTEDRLSREAERLVHSQDHIAKSSGKTLEDLVNEVKSRLAKSKRIILGDGPERADHIAPKIVKALFRLDGVDFYAEDKKLENCIAHGIYRFRVEDDRVIELVERLLSRKTTDAPYSAAWCLAYDKYVHEIRAKQIALAQQQANGSTHDEHERAAQEI